MIDALLENVEKALGRMPVKNGKEGAETFVYRGGDQIGIWTYAGLAAVGLSLASISFVAVPLSAIWLALGLWLGRKQAALAEALTVARPPRLSPMDPLPDQSLPSPSRVTT